MRKNICISWARACAYKVVHLWNVVFLFAGIRWLELLWPGCLYSHTGKLSMLDMSQTCESWAWNLCIGLAGKREGLSCPVEACLVPSVALSLPSTPEQVQLRQLCVLPCITIRISFWPPPQVCCPWSVGPCRWPPRVVVLLWNLEHWLCSRCSMFTHRQEQQQQVFRSLVLRNPP